MNTTPNYGLRKPEDTDLYNVEDFNYNMDIIDNIGSLPIVKCTQAQYDAMSSHDVNTLYVIVG